MLEITICVELSNNANVVFTYKSCTTDLDAATHCAVLFAEDKFNAKVKKYDLLEVTSYEVQH